MVKKEQRQDDYLNQQSILLTFTSLHNSLVQYKMDKNSCMVLCCQNQVSKGTGGRYGLLSSASISGYSASITVLGLLKKEEEEEEVEEEEEEEKELVQNGVLAVFRLATLTIVINGFDRSGHAPVCCLATYFYV